MIFNITVVDRACSFTCAGDQTVLSAMAAAGRRCMQVGCRSGGCGVCTVRVLSGRFRTGPMSTAQIEAAHRAEGYALACKLQPETDLQIRSIGRLTTCMPLPKAVDVCAPEGLDRIAAPPAANLAATQQFRPTPPLNLPAQTRSHAHQEREAAPA